MMLSDIHNDHTLPYQTPQQPYVPTEQQIRQPSAPLPGGYGATPPPSSGQRPPRRSNGGPRAGAILVLAVVLLLVFGTGLFSGWQFANSSASKADNSATSALQTGTNPQPTVPALTSNNI